MKKTVSLVIAALMIVALIVPVLAIQIDMKDGAGTPVYSSNVNAYTYSYYHAKIYKSFLYVNPEGGITRVENVGKKIAVENYDASYSFVSGMTVERELPLFGGFYSGENYNFLVFGQNNLEESDETEVIRIVKYSKSWQRLGADSLFGANTYIPFDAGSLRMTESGNHLFVRTCHEMYESDDGLHHQANMTILFDSSSNRIIDSFYGVLNNSYGYVSHSFNQFIKVDGDRLVCADHGDASPRAAIICRYNRTIGSTNILQGTTSNALPMSFPESPNHYNYTGASLGGFETTGVGYMLAGNANEDASSTSQPNIFLTVTPRDGYPNAATRTVWLTSYASGVNVSVPQLVKVNDDKLVVIWTENNVVKYVFVNGNGDLLGDIVTDTNMKVSDCQPILDGDRVLWYVTANTAPMFYYIYAGDGPAPAPTAVPTEAPTPTPTPLNGEMHLDKHVRLEANGTYTMIYEAYSTGTAHDKNAQLCEYFSNYFTGFSISDLNFSFKFYKYDGVDDNDEPIFTPVSGWPSGTTLGWSFGMNGGRPYFRLSGFDYRTYSCVSTDEGDLGYKFEVTVSGIKLNSNAKGTVATSNSSYISHSSSSNVNFPATTVTVGNLFAAYDFGTALHFAGDASSVLSIESNSYPKYTMENGVYNYTTSVSEAACSAVINGGGVDFSTDSINADALSMNALVLLEDGKYEWTRLTFLPATTVLYEENYIPDFTNGSHGASWETVGTAEATVQSPAAEPYGYDVSYADDAGFSHGSARTVTVTRELYDAINAAQPGASWPDARFSFKGTSLNLVSRLAPDGGIIVINIVPKGQPASTVGANTVHRMVSTYYENGIVEQAPLFNINSLEYGEYDVYLSFVYLPYFDQQSVEQRSVAPGVIPGVAKVRYEIEGELPADMRAKGSLVNYIDAVRIYNPMGTPAEGSDAHKAYGEAGELAPVYDRFKSLVTDGSALLLELGASGPIEQSGSVNMNPNTEVYLGTNALLAFGVGQGFSRIHISLRSPTGQRVIANINGNRIAVAHAAELYYDITPFIGSGGNIRISCELPEGASGEPMLSIAGVKVIGAGSVNGLFVADDSVLGYVEALYYGVSGDADHDRQVTMTDALLTMRHALDVTQLDAYALYCADMDGSGSIEVGDALWIMRLCLA